MARHSRVWCYAISLPCRSGSCQANLVRPFAILDLQWVADQEFIHNDGRVWDALPRANTPTLVMNGDRDVLVRLLCLRANRWPLLSTHPSSALGLGAACRLLQLPCFACQTGTCASATVILRLNPERLNPERLNCCAV